MIDVPTGAELGQVFTSAVTGANPDIQASTVDTEGTYLFALRAGCVALAQEVLQSHVIVARDGLETTAKGQRFDDLLWARYGRKRKPATVALVTLTFHRTGGMAGTLPAGFKVASVGNVAFVTAYAVPFGTSDVTQNVLARAAVAGPAGNVDAGAIRGLQDTPFDPSMTCTNGAVAAGGTNAQTEAEALSDVALYLASLSKGTLGAIEAAARNVPGIGKAVATEVDLPGPDGTVIAYLTTLAITDPFGGANQALADAVAVALNEARSCGVPVKVLPAETSWILVSVTYSYPAGSDLAATDARVKSAIANSINVLRPGETYDPGATAALVRSIPGVNYASVDVTFPSGQITADPDQILRTTASRVTVNGR